MNIQEKGGSHDEFVKMNFDNAEILGFWTEEYRSLILKFIESNFNKEITDRWILVDLIPNGEMFILKWKKRINFKTPKQ